MVTEHLGTSRSTPTPYIGKSLNTLMVCQTPFDQIYLRNGHFGPKEGVEETERNDKKRGRECHEGR